MFKAPSIDLVKGTPTASPVSKGFVAPKEDIESSNPLATKGRVSPTEGWEPAPGKMSDAMGLLEIPAAPFQMAGEAIRGAGESEPLKVATAKDQRGFRAPSIVQRLAPKYQTDKPPSDPFVKSYQGLEGIAALPQGINKASETVTREPGMVEQFGGMALGVGAGSALSPKTKIPSKATRTAETLGEVAPGSKQGPAHALFAYEDDFGPGGAKRKMYNVFGDPNDPLVKKVGYGSSVSEEGLNGIPITGKEPPRQGGFASSPKEPPLEPMGGGPKQVPPSQMPPDPNAPPITPPKPPIDPVQEVQNYIGKGYENFAKKPGNTVKIADYMQEKSQMWAIKEAGGGPRMVYQMQKVGKTPIQINDELRTTGQYLLDSEIVKQGLGNDAMLKRHSELLKASGKKIGDVRELADSRRIPTQHSVDTLQTIQEKLGNTYKEGMPGEAQYQQALRIVAESEPTFSGQAEAATKLNKLANKANSDSQPHTPFTAVANEISRVNNERVKEVVPELAEAYEQALREFGVNKRIEKMLGRKIGTGVKRMHVGGIGGNIAQTFMDEAGYKIGARVANKVSTRIKKDPSVAKDLPSLFKEFINEIDDIFPDDVPNMAHGGIVGNTELNNFLENKYGGRNTNEKATR